MAGAPAERLIPGPPMAYICHCQCCLPAGTLSHMNAPEEREAANSALTGRQRGRIPADTFAVRLMLARALAGHLSIREACELTGLNRGSWQGWERGLRPRDILDVAQCIAASLDVDEHWLLFGGPLAGPRGMPTKRPPSPTHEYLPVPIRPRDTRPSGRSGTGQDRATTGPTPRRPARISRMQVA